MNTLQESAARDPRPPIAPDPEPVPVTARGRRVLIVAGDADQRAWLGRTFDSWGDSVCAVDSAEAALPRDERLDADLVLIDLVLPGLSGLELARAIRADPHGRQPLLFFMLDVWNDAIDWIARGATVADDYLVRPFGARELKLRMDTHLRRRRLPGADGALPMARAEGRPRHFTCGALEIDVDRHRVHVLGREIAVTATEMQLLIYFCHSAGLLCSRRLLLTTVWGYQPDVSTRTIDVCIKRLRDKLGPAGRLIETVRGLGYRFAASEEVTVGR
jgi:two-component system phosphate regulon response regulator PhoB